MSSTTPTIVIQSGAPSPVPVSIRWPNGLSPGQYSRASASLMTTAGAGVLPIPVVEETPGAEARANRLQVVVTHETEQRILRQSARRGLVLDLQAHGVPARRVGQIRGQPDCVTPGSSFTRAWRSL